MPSLLVTNDFPPKLGGIQTYLWELWRRLPAGETTVLTTRYAGADAFDAEAATDGLRIGRAPQRVLLPGRALAARVRSLADDIGADVVFLDPALPLGAIGPALGDRPNVLILHGAEITVPGRLPATNFLVRKVLRETQGVIAAGAWTGRHAARIAGRELRGVVIPPGVDTERFVPVDDATRRATRVRHGLDPDRPLVLGLSRLVPRKGFDVVIDAVAGLDDSVQLAIAGAGRDEHRLRARAATRLADGRIHFLGRVPDADLPSLYGSADVFAMLCRDRWAGMEAEGFGIVFVEAASCGVPSVVGRSGGSHEAISDGETGLVVDPNDMHEARDALARLLGDDALARRLGQAARRRAVEAQSWDRMAGQLLAVHRDGVAALGTILPAELPA